VAGACPTQSSRTDCILGLPLSTTSVFTARAWASTVCANVSAAIPARTRTLSPGARSGLPRAAARSFECSARDRSGFRASAAGPLPRVRLLDGRIEPPSVALGEWKGKAMVSARMTAFVSPLGRQRAAWSRRRPGGVALVAEAAGQ
jgi:hypothetical protein